MVPALHHHQLLPVQQPQELPRHEAEGGHIGPLQLLVGVEQIGRQGARPDEQIGEPLREQDRLTDQKDEQSGQQRPRDGDEALIGEGVDEDGHSQGGHGDHHDGGARHFAQTISAIRAQSPDTTIEVLTPDFLRKDGAVEIVVAARPDVFNHNMETVPRLYPSIRPGARYFHSLSVLHKVKTLDPSIFTKSGIMVGLGETDEEVGQLMDDLRSADVDFMTIGQYLQPTPKHAEVARFVTPENFTHYSKTGRSKGFLLISATPLTRSSYHADQDFAELQAARQDMLQAR